MTIPIVRSFALLSLLLHLSTPALTQPSASAAVDGVWLGTIHSESKTLRYQLHLKSGAAGAENCALDSIDQKYFGIHCYHVQVAGDAVSIDFPEVPGNLRGNLSADGNTISGTWTQAGNALPLILERETTAIEPPKYVKPAFDPAMPPVGVADLKTVLDHDLALAINSGALSPATRNGVTIGVVQHGVQRIFSYGIAKPDSIFEIGSITKTFTSLLLAQMVEEGKVRLDEPIRELLPPGTVAKPASGAEITLLDLSDQHSGLPPMPDNFPRADKNNPFADYNVKLLYAFVAQNGVALYANAPFIYSNLGVGLLGQALADHEHTTYANLLHDQITAPLNMQDTGIALTAEMKARLMVGHGEWDFDALAGAGAIRSTAADMLVYLQAQLHPDRLPASTLATPNGKTLPAAIAMSHQVHAETSKGEHIALNWFRDDATGSYSHGGVTGAYVCYALFNPEKDFAVIVLSNKMPAQGVSVGDLAQHIEQRLNGSAAISLATGQAPR